MSYVFNIPFRGNGKLRQVMEKVKEDSQLHTFWKCANVMSIDRMGYNDHGPTHVKIVANLALKLLRILIKNKVKPSIVRNYGMKNEDAEVEVVLSSILHDIGMIVARKDHEKYGVSITLPMIGKYLASVYSMEHQSIITSEVLHCIVAHEHPNKPLTVEAGVVGIADALDMEAGRARIPFEAGKIDIHSVSALSIQNVEIIEGGRKPITVKVTMSDSAGVFQIDELLKPRIEDSGLKEYFHVTAEVTGGKDGCLLDKLEF